MDVQLLVSNIARHISLTNDEKDFFLSLLNMRSVEKGDFLLREGDICRYQSFILTGCFKIYYSDTKGIEHITDFLVEEWWADDLYSFLTGTASRSNIKAIENAGVVQISKGNLELLYEKLPKFERFFRILFQRAYISQKEHINMMLSASAEQRYTLFHKNKPYAENRFAQKDIASYLGVTPQFLSTLKKKLQRVNVD